jgi:hypothetical protein
MLNTLKNIENGTESAPLKITSNKKITGLLSSILTEAPLAKSPYCFNQDIWFSPKGCKQPSKRNV